MTGKFDVDRLFSQFEETHKQASVDAAFGTPIEAAGKTVIPIASAMYGFGMGGGEGEREGRSDVGGGGGGGYMVRPLALAVIDEGGVHIQPVVNAGRIVLAGILVGAWSIFWLGRVMLRLASKKT